MESQQKATYLPTDFTETHQSHDLKLLFTIYSLIQDYKSNKTISLPETLEKIGFFAQRVSFRDKDHERIRNKYGYIQRHKHNKINPSGIPLEDLYLLHILYKHNKLHVNPEEQQVILLKNLESLQNKIAFILKTEALILTSEPLLLSPELRHIISLWKNQQDSVKDLQLFAKKKYARFVLENIKVESALLFRPLDLLRREDRYLAVRLLHKFGEWSHQFLVGTQVNLEPELDMESLKLLNDIRDNLKKIILRLDFPLSQDPEIVNKAQEAVSKAFSMLSELREGNDLKALHVELRNIRKYFLVSGSVEKDPEKYNKKKTEKVIEEEKILKLKSIASLNAMVRAAEKLFDTASILGKYQREYCILLAKVDNLNGFPEKLYIEQREYIKEIIGKRQNEEEGSPMAKVITILTRAMKNIDHHEAGSQEKFNEIQVKYKEKLLKFEENYGIEHDYPKELSPLYEKEIKEKVKRLKNETFQAVEKQREVAFTENDQKTIVKYMEKVIIELEYAASLLPLCNEQIRRILELLVCVIADLLQEVGGLLRDERLMCFSENIRPLVKILIKTRNQLCHDTFLVDKELFLRIVKDTVACSEEFRGFYLRERERENSFRKN